MTLVVSVAKGRQKNAFSDVSRCGRLLVACFLEAPTQPFTAEYSIAPTGKHKLSLYAEGS
jgi:hypothetical protein